MWTHGYSSRYNSSWRQRNRGPSLSTQTKSTAPENNRIHAEDRAVHDWYRFVLSFPPHLVRDYIQRFGLKKSATVLDPFCGTGTTLVECKKLGFRSVGVEANPLAAFASRTKVNWALESEKLRKHAHGIAQQALDELAGQGFDDMWDLPLFRQEPTSAAETRTLPPETGGLLLKNSISPLPLHKTLVLLDVIRNSLEPFTDHELLALANALVSGISNLRFGPEVGLGVLKVDAPVVNLWLGSVESIADDLAALAGHPPTPSTVFLGDARNPRTFLEDNSVDAVITSPPYPNEKDYSRTTRLESVLLGYVRTKEDLRRVKQSLVRSNTRGVYKDDADHLLVAEHPEIQRIAQAIEKRRVELGKTSGFERLYARVTQLYFGGMAHHLAELRSILRPGAHLAYVVGDQASYLQVMIRTGQLLADIAESLGYEVLGLDLFRTRAATATRQQLREEVLLLRWPRA